MGKPRRKWGGVSPGVRDRQMEGRQVAEEKQMEMKGEMEVKQRARPELPRNKSQTHRESSTEKRQVRDSTDMPPRAGVRTTTDQARSPAGGARMCTHQRKGCPHL